MTPATEEKAARMLSGGHLKIHTASTDYISAVCFSSTSQVAYEVSRDPGGWHCTCPARQECSHIRALKLVTVWNLRWPG